MTEKIYLENPYLRQLDARVIEKEYKNDNYYIKLNKTIFYPNLAGGQPGDRGTINGVEVLDCYEEEKEIIHVVGENINSDKVVLNIDWDNRLDYMQQHSGQHLLSAVFYKLFNAETLDFYIGKDHLHIDLNLPYLSDRGVEKIEKFTNKIIFSNFPIKSYVIEKDTIDKDLIERNKINNSSIRIIEIDEIDFTPCCGTHLRNTGEIGLIKINNYYKIDAGIRVEFICGNRALTDYREKDRLINSISDFLDTDEEKLELKLNKYRLELDRLAEENRKLSRQVLEFKARDILKEAESYKDLYFISHEDKSLSKEELLSLIEYLIEKDNHLVFIGRAGEEDNYGLGLSPNLDLKLDRLENIKTSHENIYLGSSQDLEATMRECFNYILEEIK